jgi:hypothetical protein
LLTEPELLTDHPARSAYLTGEGGVFTVLTVGVLALWCVRRMPSGRT